ncbi:MAG: hypothetical protein H7259_01300 [Cytophagales bacterium]|nr:hypothetical protein [Cytophaga sp.]
MNKLNAFQVIAVFGIIFSAAAQLVLFFMDKQVDNYVYLYPTWVAIFIIGYVINPYLSKYDNDDHHH